MNSDRNFDGMRGTSGKRVLIVDDNKSIRTMVADYLGARGYEVVQAADGIKGLDYGLSANANLIILDVVMPGIDGVKLCQLLREKGVTTPIIMLTEKATIKDKEAGYGVGVDDYLAKPFSPRELELRIESLRKRTQTAVRAPEPKVLKRGELEIDLTKHIVKVGGTEVVLTPIEFNILRLLASAPGHVYSREDLLNAIWDTAYEGYKRNIDPHVNRLRTKIEENPKRPKYVLTVWGIGYKFNDALP
ncbi:MAG TPA: response regulator transcription factor [Blastocatellia bacterium]|nr:response regulator transcription factor [Blastocatellia bacterium]